MQSTLISSSNNDSIAFLSDLRRFSDQAEMVKTAAREAAKISVREAQSHSLLENSQSYAFSYAAPLMPLRERDINAMEALFDRNDSDDIEAEINNALLWLLPEPCWEDSPFDFLHEYL